MLNGALISVGIGFFIAIYSSLFVVEYPVSGELALHFLLYIAPWAIVGGAIGWLTDRRIRSAP